MPDEKHRAADLWLFFFSLVDHIHYYLTSMTQGAHKNYMAKNLISLAKEIYVELLQQKHQVEAAADDT